MRDTEDIAVITPSPGTPLIQYLGRSGRIGDYFADPGTAMNTLGISGNRQMDTFTVTSSTLALESTAADTRGFTTWPSELQGPGGGIQYYVPNHSSIQILGETS